MTAAHHTGRRAYAERAEAETVSNAPAVRRSQIPADINDRSVHSFCLGVAETRIEKLRAALEHIAESEYGRGEIALAALHLDDIAAPLMDRTSPRKEGGT